MKNGAVKKIKKTVIAETKSAQRQEKEKQERIAVQLHEATYFGDTEKMIALIEDEGADVNGQIHDLREIHPSEIKAMHPGFVSIYKQHHALRPLHTAAKMNNIRAMKILIDHHAKINQQTSSGQTALDLAALNGNVEAALFLMKGKQLKETPNEEDQDEDGEIVSFEKFDEQADTPVLRKIGLSFILMQLFDAGPLRDAFLKNSAPLVEMISALIGLGVNVASDAPMREFALFTAVLHNDAELVKAILNAPIDEFEDYLNLKAPLANEFIQAKPEELLAIEEEHRQYPPDQIREVTALTVAIERNQIDISSDIIRAYLRNGFDITKIQCPDGTLLHWAVKIGDPSLVDEILKATPRDYWELKNNVGKTAIECANHTMDLGGVSIRTMMGEILEKNHIILPPIKNTPIKRIRTIDLNEEPSQKRSKSNSGAPITPAATLARTQQAEPTTPLTEEEQRQLETREKRLKYFSK